MPDSEITDAVESQQNRLLVRMAYAASGTAGVVVIAIAGWVINECVESRQFRTSGDRYTQQDAAQDRAELVERIARLRDDLTRMQVTLERIEKGM